jgi:phospholipase C
VDPVAGTNNYYKRDSFGLDADPSSTSQAAYVNCSDPTQPGVAAISAYLGSLPYAPFRGGNCDPGRFYAVNNNYPSYAVDGTPITKSNAFPAGPDYAVGPSSIPTIGDALSANHVSWRYYGEGASLENADPPQNLLYCEICNPFQYTKSIMTTSQRENTRDIDDFFADVESGSLPSVAYVKPDTLLDSHPGTSTPPLYEAFVQNIVDSVQANPKLWATTAIFITFDEGGGTYDSGYIQPIDFFGDGPRTVMIVVSPFAKRGFVDHTYADHASVVKFIERNWRLAPLSERSRDNLPNPVAQPDAPYFPTNAPAIGDLTTLFDF